MRITKTYTKVRVGKHLFNYSLHEARLLLEKLTGSQHVTF